jgi:hypothetical protein
MFFIQDTPVSKMPSYWTDRSACMQSGLGIYGLVSSKKLDYEQKIILEVVPWVITNSVAAGLLKTEKQLLINAKHLWLKK